MNRTVHCRKYQRDMEGLDKPPYPGPKGQALYDTVSKQAWQEWQKHQTMLINEKHLNMRDAQARAFLQTEMEKFLSGEDFEQAEGYVPPADEKVPTANLDKPTANEDKTTAKEDKTTATEFDTNATKK